MAYSINDSCVACGACANDCPVDAIKAGDPTYSINADECIDCAACTSSCPVDAIVA